MNHKINIKTIAITGILVFVSFFFHELAHYFMGTVFGHEMVLTLNSVSLKDGVYDSNVQRQLVSAAGPIFTIITAIIAFIILKKRDNKYLYIFLFITFFMRMAAAIVSVFNPNDEARISESLGIGQMTLPIIVTLSLLGLVIAIANKHKYNWKFNLAMYFIVSVYIALLVLSDQYVIKPWVYS